MTFLPKAMLVIGLAFAPTSDPTTWNFENDPPGRIAKGFTAKVGTWIVESDPTAKNHVLAQTAKNDDDTFNVALVDQSDFSDLDLSVRVKAVAGELDRGGGLVWRSNDEKNYYIVRYNPLEGNFRLYKVVAGVRTQFASATVKADQEWHTIRVVMTAQNMTCYFDGAPLLSVEDATFPGPGMIGLWSKADAQSLFDDLKAVSLVEP